MHQGPPKKASAAAGGSGVAKGWLWLCEADWFNVHGDTEPQGAAHSGTRGTSLSMLERRAICLKMEVGSADSVSAARNGGMARQAIYPRGRSNQHMYSYRHDRRVQSAADLLDANGEI